MCEVRPPKNRILPHIPKIASLIISHVPSGGLSLSHAVSLARACSSSALWLLWPQASTALVTLESGIVHLYNTLHAAAIAAKKCGIGLDFFCGTSYFRVGRCGTRR